MRFRILSHACLEISARGKTLLIDPWLIGSCYWRSWWNYPPVDPALVENLQPDFVYITHIHWDHFHGPTLKRFDPDTPILIPLERSTRMRRDLEAMGFTRVVEIPHGRSYDLAADFRITAYQFSPWGDSAAVIDAEGHLLLDANDAKFMGWPLDQIVRAHGRFDFAFRSHSSANHRACYQFYDAPDLPPDDQTVYARSFYNFMECVKPRYAVPFASNHCHLHRDVFQFNEFVTTPQLVEEHVARRGGFSDTELKIMLSGDGWDSGTGFSIAENDWFTNRQQHLDEYRDQERPRLEAQYARENRIRLPMRVVERFFDAFFKAVPALARRRMRGRHVYFHARSSADQYFGVDLSGKRVWECDPDALEGKEPIVIETSALVLYQSMALNMFSHMGISKRVMFHCRKADAVYLNTFLQLLAAYEYEVLPLSRLLSARTAGVYARRWRELALYGRVLLSLRSGRTIHEVEERLMQTLADSPSGQAAGT